MSCCILLASVLGRLWRVVRGMPASAEETTRRLDANTRRATPGSSMAADVEHG